MSARLGLRIVVTVLSTVFVALFCLVACTTREVPVTPVPQKWYSPRSSAKFR